MTQVYLSGIGLHTTLGRGLDANLAALSRAPVAPQMHEVEFAGGPRSLPYYILADEPLRDLERRFNRVIDGAIDAALSEANLNAAERRSLALFIGSSCGDIPLLESEYRRDLQESKSAMAMAHSSTLGRVANEVRSRFGLRGPDCSFFTACTASANAILYASNLIRSGQLTHALVLGVEIFNAVTALGFTGLQLLTRDVMRPFDRRRSGLVPGEACAAIVLSNSPSGRYPWRILGGANLCDTFSITASNPDGSAVLAVMQQALQSVGLHPAQIAAIKMHGTASLSNDETEATGLKRMFVAPPPLCALKPYLGHTFGACGAAELAIFCESVARDRLPGTPGICAGDSDLQLMLNQNLTAQSPGYFLLNHFGFGGSDTSLVVTNL